MTKNTRNDPAPTTPMQSCSLNELLFPGRVAPENCLLSTELLNEQPLPMLNTGAGGSFARSDTHMQLPPSLTLRSILDDAMQFLDDIGQEQAVEQEGQNEGSPNKRKDKPTANFDPPGSPARQ